MYYCLIEEAAIFLTSVNPINLPKVLPIFCMTSSLHKGKDKMGNLTQTNMENGFDYGNQVTKKNHPHPKLRTLLPLLSSYLQLHCYELWKSLKHGILPINLLSSCHLSSSWNHHSLANICQNSRSRPHLWRISCYYKHILMILSKPG